MTRSSSTRAGAARLLAGLLLASAVVWFGAGPSAADDVERANCPPGFVWIRMSGTGCVQETSTLPDHGKIGYDGHALCIEPYLGIYEQRSTTDGQPAPGSPYTSFAYLKKCVTQEQYDAAIAKEKEKRGESDSGMPSGLRTGAAGLAVVAGLVALGSAAVLVNRHRKPTADQIAEKERLAERKKDLEKRLADAVTKRDQIRQTLQHMREELTSDQWDLDDLNNVVGLVTSLLSLGGNWAKGWGITSILSTLKGEGTAALTDADAEDRINELLERMEIAVGASEAEVNALTQDLADLANQVEPNRLAAESYTDYDVLQEQIDKVNAESLEHLQQRNAHEIKRGELQLQLDDLDDKIDRIRDQMFEVEYGHINHETLARGAGVTSIIAGLVALGPPGTAAVGIAGVASALASATGFTEFLIGLRVDEVKRLLSASAQGYQRMRGQVLFQMENEARLQDNAQKLYDNAKAYHDRLREQQAQITSQTNRGVLWPKK